MAVQVTAEVSVKEAAQEQITAIQADPESFGYDNLKEGYETPEATTITLTNTGNTTISLAQPYAEYFDIGELSTSVLEPEDSATFTAVPVTGLKAGDYLDSIQIARTDTEGQEDVLTTIKASVTVSEVEKVYKLSVTPEELNFGKAKEGYSEAPKAQKVTLTNEMCIRDRVKAGTQSSMMEVIEPMLTEEEHSVYRRGRNAHSPTTVSYTHLDVYKRQPVLLWQRLLRQTSMKTGQMFPVSW